MSLQVQDLVVARGGRTVLDAISASFERGRTTAVLGPNGAGKSTLLGCMAGLIKAQAGSVHIDGAWLQDMPGPQRARCIGYLPQTPEIAWPVSVATLVGLARIPHRNVSSAREDALAVQAALSRTGTMHWADRDVQSLSGGERARVLLARLIAGEPQYVLADEPFTGLDPSHQFEAADLLRSLAAAGCGVIFTVHDLTLAARLADDVIVLSEGRIAAQGTPAAALTASVLRSVYDIDARWVSLEDDGAYIAVRRRAG